MNRQEEIVTCFIKNNIDKYREIKWPTHKHIWANNFMCHDFDSEELSRCFIITEDDCTCVLIEKDAFSHKWNVYAVIDMDTDSELPNDLIEYVWKYEDKESAITKITELGIDLNNIEQY